MSDATRENNRRRAQIFHALKRLERAAIKDEILLSSFYHLLGEIRMNREDINNEISALRALIAEDNRKDQEAVDTLNRTIVNLREQLQQSQTNPSDETNAAFDDIFSQLEGLKSLIQPVDITSGAQNRTTTDANGESPVAGVTSGGTPINKSDAPAEPGNNTDAQEGAQPMTNPDGSTSPSTEPASGQPIE